VEVLGPDAGGLGGGQPAASWGRAEHSEVIFEHVDRADSQARHVVGDVGEAFVPGVDVLVDVDPQADAAAAQLRVKEHSLSPEQGTAAPEPDTR